MTWLLSNALIQDYANWLFLPEAAAESGEESYWAGQPFAPLNVMPTPHSFWLNDKMMEPSNLSQFGLTSKLLTERLGGAVLTWYLEVSLAKTSQPPAKAQASPESAAACGNTWLGSLAKYDPATHSLKTHQCSLLEDSTPSSVTLPRWGTMQNGVLLARATPEHLTNANASGYSPTWPTLRASDSNRNGSTPNNWNRTFTGNRLTDAVKLYPTMTCQGLNGGSNSRKAALKRHMPTLSATDATRGGKQITENMGGGSLRQFVGGRLNPTWAEWFMGWPIGSTELEPLATDKYQQWCNWHGMN